MRRGRSHLPEIVPRQSGGIGLVAAAAISFARAVPQTRRWRSEQAVTSPAESGVTRIPEGVTGGGS